MASAGIIRQLAIAVGVKFDKKSFDRVKSGADSIAAAMQAAADEARKLEGDVDGLAGELDSLADEAAEVPQEMDRASKSMDKAAKSSNNAGNNVKEAAKALTVIVGAAAAAAAGLFALTKTINGEADAAIKLARSLGLTVEELSELRIVAGLGGVSTEQLNVGLKTLTRNLEAASRGTGEAVEAFKGIDLTTETGELIGVSEALSKLSERFTEIQDPVRRAAFAQRVFGKSGTDLLPILTRGAAGFEELRQAAREAGATISTEGAEAAERFDDSLLLLRTSIGSITRSLAFGITPALTDLIDGLRGWISENKELIAQKIDAAVQLINVAIENAIPITYALGVAVAILGGIFASTLSPVILIVAAVVAAIVALALVIEDLVTAAQGGESVIMDFAESIGAGSALGQALDYAGSAIESLINIFGSLFDLLVNSKAFEFFADAVDTVFETTLKGVFKAVRDALGFISDALLSLDVFLENAVEEQTAAATLSGRDAAAAPQSINNAVSFGAVTVNANGLDEAQARNLIGEELEGRILSTIEAGGR